MKKLKVVKGAKCMACLECVRACSTSFYKEFDPDKSCIQIIDKNGDAKPMVCVQCGKCAKACPEGAITQNAKGVYIINKKKCVGCGKCAQLCPLNNVHLENSRPQWGDHCTHCMACISICPVQAIEYGKGTEGKNRYYLD